MTLGFGSRLQGTDTNLRRLVGLSVTGWSWSRAPAFAASPASASLLSTDT